MSSSTAGRHRSVLSHQAIDSLALSADDTVVDATLGGAGHAREIVSKLGRDGTFIGFDLDADAIQRAQAALEGSICTTHFVEGNFKDLEGELKKFNIGTIDKALFDLGWSSYQLDAGRGFSFQKDEPLLMTYAKEGGALNAGMIVNTWSEGSIADVIFGWGQERYARRIAKRIVEEREKKKFETARELADVVKAAVPARSRFGRIHPATKTFQALRIAVNDELGSLKEGLAAAWKNLAPGGRIAVITFHSIEDREVKRFFASLVEQGGMLISKKPVTPTREEIQENPRARSAKLRVIQKTT
ncbi:MAG TPA: 16S rRNA (cytosine(1402)-N(4))-methyltransferase RsmH [Candidatus Paceibacterota bacterium]|nr:16S rRNA (cytosine(1402)-N(4))-methyltransferase RsmH [Candidatus Paceibacterota bacterium]